MASPVHASEALLEREYHMANATAAIAASINGHAGEELLECNINDDDNETLAAMKEDARNKDAQIDSSSSAATTATTSAPSATSQSTATMRRHTTGSLVPTHALDDTVDVMRTVDQIRHRLKRPSTVSTLTGSSNTSSARDLHAPSTLSGFLRMRQSAREWRMKTWYCVLYNAHVYWYASKKDAQVAKRLQGHVRVVSACASAGAGKIHTYPHAFVFTAKSGQVYFCSAPTPEDQQQWIASMNAAAAAAEAQQQAASLEPRSSDANKTLGSASSTTSSSQSSLVALESLAEETDADPMPPTHPVLVAHGAPETLSFRRARVSGRLELDAKTPSDLACFACDLEFSALRRRRHVCTSCGFGFCRWHCATYVSLECNGAVLVGRVCDGCAQRQHFITFVVALTSSLVSRTGSSSSDSIGAFALECAHDCFQREQARSASATDSLTRVPRCHRRQWRELEVLVSSLASFTPLNVMCFLKKYQRMPWLFARTLCLFIALFETDAEALAASWVQFLSLLVPLIQSVYPDQEYTHATLPTASSAADYVHVTSDEQQSSLRLYVDLTLAICRRSSAFALATVWECLALYEDAQQHGRVVCANYIVLLIYRVSAFDGDSELVANLWLRDAPDTQADAVVAAMDDYLRVTDAVHATTPQTLTAQWIHATDAHAIARWTQRIVRIIGEPAGATATLSPRELLKLFSPVAAEAEALFASLVLNSDVETDALPVSHAKTQDERRFNAEANFVHNLTAIAERLRHVTPVSERARVLPKLLRRLQATLGTGAAGLSNLQYLPVFGGGSDTNKRSSAAQTPTILRVVLDEGKVFSTRCRAPTMIVFEALMPEPLESVSSDGKESDEDEVVHPVDAGVVAPKPPSLRKLGRQDSEMLDRLLCSFDKAALASLLQDDDDGRNDDDDESPRADASALLSPSSESNDETHDAEDADVENEPPPEDMAKEDARVVYEESTSAYLQGDNASQVDPNSTKTRRSAETWAEKTERIRQMSEFGDLPGWTLVSVIAKSFDDLRQEVFALQLMSALQAIFEGNDLAQLYLRPYKYVRL